MGGGGARSCTRPVSTPAPDPTASRPASTRSRAWAVTKFVLGLAVAAVAVWAVAGKTDELQGATTYLDRLHWGWIVLGVAAEVLSYMCFASMQRRLLHAGGTRVPLAPMTGITLAGNAMQTSLPAGVVLSVAYAFRQYRRYGADDVLAGWVVVAMTVLSIMTLSLLAAVGLALAASTGSALDLVGVILGVLAVMAALAVAWSRRTWVVAHATGVVRVSQRVIHRPAGDPGRFVADATTRVSAISPQRRDWLVAGGFAAGNWVFDLGCLTMAFLCVGADVPWRGLLLAYAAAQLATNLPVTPGGLGVVEGSLTIALVTFGGAEGSTVAAVLVYRILSFWLVVPAGWGAWGVLAWITRRAGQSDADATASGTNARPATGTVLDAPAPDRALP